MTASPIVIEGLTKRYDSDVLAVDHLDLSVESGSVFGLLGPNGAGKTTTMRMLVGLIRPTSGGVRLFGESVKPGAAVLGRVGVLVEGPGFVPHLSGHENLELFWRAGRAPLRTPTSSTLSRSPTSAKLPTASTGRTPMGCGSAWGWHKLCWGPRTCSCSMSQRTGSILNRCVKPERYSGMWQRAGRRCWYRAIF